MAYTPYSVMDICSYCEVATESIQKSIEIGNFDGATIQLCSYLIEIYTRYQNHEIDLDTWRETLCFYRRMQATIIEEQNIQQEIIEKEKEKIEHEDSKRD